MTASAPSTSLHAVAAPRFDVEEIRKDFAALNQTVHGKPLVYLDSAATALKPRAVVDAVRNIYEKDTANVHRGVHLLSQRATEPVTKSDPVSSSFHARRDSAPAGSTSSESRKPR